MIAAVQDLSQVRGRWGTEVADGFLSLFQHVVVLGGVRDTRTLEALSTICGEHERTQTSVTKTRSRETFKPWQPGSTSIAHGTSVQKQRRMGAGDIYALEDGTALHLHGSGWRPIRLAPHYAHPRWRRVLAAAPEHLRTHPDPVLERDLLAVTQSTAGPSRVPADIAAGHPSQSGRQQRVSWRLRFRQTARDTQRSL